MSESPNNADSDGEAGFTCSALLMCLWCLPGRSSKKKPDVEEVSTSVPHFGETGPAPELQPAEAEQVPSRAASLEKLECVSLYSGSNIVFDFVVGETEHAAAGGASAANQGYCPSPCFDLPVELIRAGERYGTSSDAPVAAAFVFGDCQGTALKKMASCLASGAEGVEARPPHLVRFLSAASGSSVTPSRGPPPNGTAVDCDFEFADGVCAQRRPAGRLSRAGAAV